MGMYPANERLFKVRVNAAKRALRNTQPTNKFQLITAAIQLAREDRYQPVESCDPLADALDDELGRMP